MSEKIGIQEFKDVIIAVKALTVDSITKFGDGFDISDLSVLTENITLLKNAIEGVNKVGVELKDLDRQEIKEIVSEATDLVFGILDAVMILKEKKKEPVAV